VTKKDCSAPLKILPATHCMQLVVANPEDACSELQGDYANKVVMFVEGGSCSLDDKGGFVSASDAVAGVYAGGVPY